MCGGRAADQKTHKPKSSCSKQAMAIGKLPIAIACLGGRSAPTKEHQNMNCSSSKYAKPFFYNLERTGCVAAERGSKEYTNDTQTHKGTNTKGHKHTDGRGERRRDSAVWMSGRFGCVHVLSIVFYKKISTKKCFGCECAEYLVALFCGDFIMYV